MSIFKRDYIMFINRIGRYRLQTDAMGNHYYIDGFGIVRLLYDEDLDKVLWLCDSSKYVKNETEITGKK